MVRWQQRILSEFGFCFWLFVGFLTKISKTKNHFCSFSWSILGLNTSAAKLSELVMNTFQQNTLPEALLPVARWSKIQTLTTTTSKPIMTTTDLIVNFPSLQQRSRRRRVRFVDVAVCCIGIEHLLTPACAVRSGWGITDCDASMRSLQSRRDKDHLQGSDGRLSQLLRYLRHGGPH